MSATAIAQKRLERLHSKGPQPASPAKKLASAVVNEPESTVRQSTNTLSGAPAPAVRAPTRQSEARQSIRRSQASSRLSPGAGNRQQRALRYSEASLRSKHLFQPQKQLPGASRATVSVGGAQLKVGDPVWVREEDRASAEARRSAEQVHAASVTTAPHAPARLL